MRKYARNVATKLQVVRNAAQNFIARIGGMSKLFIDFSSIVKKFIFWQVWHGACYSIVKPTAYM